MSGGRRWPSSKLQAEIRAAAVEARRQARAEAKAAEDVRPSTSIERMWFVGRRLQEEGFSARTVHNYLGEIRRGEWWFEARGKTLLTAPAEMVAEYVASGPTASRPESWFALPSGTTGE